MTRLPEPAARESVIKSKNGCITCRIRRVKCDEARPACSRCTTTRRRCDGYLPEGVSVPRRRLADLVRQTPAIGPASEALAPILRRAPQKHTSSLDALCFDTFRHMTVPSTASILPSSFWTRDVLQMAHGDSAMWHATLAVGAIHRQWESERRDRGRPADPVLAAAGAFRRCSLTHYFRAISLAKSISDVATLRALSIVLVAASNVLGRWADSQTHLLGGLRLLEREQERGAGVEIDGAAEVLERLDLQAMTFSDRQAPYPYQSPVWLQALHKRLHGPQPISSYGQAGTLLFALLRRFILISVNGGDSDSSKILFDILTSELEAWEAKMQAFEDAGPREELPALAVRLYHSHIRAFLASTFEGAETRFDTDKCLFYFERIVLLGERLHREVDHQSLNPLTLEPALVIPLFWTAHRCRHSPLRRRAARVLRECRRMEGMWSSDGMALVVDRIIAVEDDVEHPEGGSEGPASPDTTAPDTSAIGDPTDIPWDTFSSSAPLVPRTVSWKGVGMVPESRRVKDLLVLIDHEIGRADIRMIFADVLSPGNPVVMEDTVYFGTHHTGVSNAKVLARDLHPRPNYSYSSKGWVGSKRGFRTPLDY